MFVLTPVRCTSCNVIPELTFAQVQNVSITYAVYELQLNRSSVNNRDLKFQSPVRCTSCNSNPDALHRLYRVSITCAVYELQRSWGKWYSFDLTVSITCAVYELQQHPRKQWAICCTSFNHLCGVRVATHQLVTNYNRNISFNHLCGVRVATFDINIKGFVH